METERSSGSTVPPPAHWITDETGRISSSVLVPLVCTTTAQEPVRVLAYPKFRLSSQDQEELLADYLPYTQTIQIPHPPPAVPECRDPMDLVFMQLAVAGLAKVLVSGDQDLLVLTDKFARAGHYTIMTMAAFVSAYPAVVS